jgi:hypothetical protein
MSRRDSLQEALDAINEMEARQLQEAFDARRVAEEAETRRLQEAFAHEEGGQDIQHAIRESMASQPKSPRRDPLPPRIFPAVVSASVRAVDTAAGAFTNVAAGAVAGAVAGAASTASFQPGWWKSHVDTRAQREALEKAERDSEALARMLQQQEDEAAAGMGVQADAAAQRKAVAATRAEAAQRRADENSARGAPHRGRRRLGLP